MNDITKLTLQEIRKVENKVFRKAKGEAWGPNDKLLGNFLAVATELFLSYFQLNPKYEEMPKINLENSYNILNQHLSDRMEVRKNFYGYYYSDNIEIKIDDLLSLELNRSGQEQFQVWANRSYSRYHYMPHPSCTVAENKLDEFCLLIDYIYDNFGRWKAKAEKYVQKLFEWREQCDNDCEKMYPFLRAEFDHEPMDLEYFIHWGPKNYVVEIQLSDQQKGYFTLKRDNWENELPQAIEFAKHMYEYFKKFDDFKIPYKLVRKEDEEE